MSFAGVCQCHTAKGPLVHSKSRTDLWTKYYADPDAVVWNTRMLGRPDMVNQLVVQSNAEAVFIISNPKLTKKVVYGMQTRGIAAYGAIFDS